MPARPQWRAGLFALTLIATPAASAEPTAVDTPVVLGITINESSEEYSAFFLRRPDGLWASAEDLDQWRIIRPPVPPVQVAGIAYLPLSGITGAKTVFDETTQSIRLTVPIDAFRTQTFTPGAIERRALTASVPSAFVNYDIAAESVGTHVSVRGFFEAGTSADWGLASTSFTVGSTFGGEAVTRLESYLLHDNPETATRLTVGDAITASSVWSRPIRYAGVKVGTDFGLRPGYITFPTANFQGRTVLPSSVEFYADGALRYRNSIDRGPFAVDQAPLPAGAGLLTVVTRDVLGIERRTTTPYYVSTNLLRSGLSKYSFEVGVERDDYGRQSFDYSRPFIAGLYRRGLTERITVETRTEIGSRVQAGGMSVATALPRVGEFGGTLALSKGGGGTGVLWGLNYARNSQVWDVGLSIQQTNLSYLQLGIRERSEQIRRQIQGNAGRTLGRFGRIGLSLANLRTADRDETSVASASYSVNVGRGYLDAFGVVAKSESSRTNTGIGVGFTLPFGARKTVRVGAELQNGNFSVLGEYRVSPPTDRGWGYGGAVRLGAFDQQRADATFNGDHGEVRFDAARFDGETGLRATGRGGIALAEGQLFATRQLDGAFGIVEAGGFSGVRVYQDNRPLTKTNARGLAIIPALRPYEENSIRLAPDDMPIGARVDADDITLVPGYRKGVTARFEVKTGRPAIVILAAPSGQEIPPGTPIVVDGGRERTFAGYDGTVFVTNAKPQMTVEAELPAGKCAVSVSLPAEVVDLPQVGPVSCVLQGDAK